MAEAPFEVNGTFGPKRFKKWHVCIKCSLSYPEDKMKLFRGSWYGIPCGDHRDIWSILRSEEAARSRELTRNKNTDINRR